MMCYAASYCLLPFPEAGAFVELRRPLKLDRNPDAPLVKPDRLLLLRPPGNAEGSTSPKDCCAIAVTSAALPPSRELNAPKRSLVPVVNLFCRPCKVSKASVSGGLVHNQKMAVLQEWWQRMSRRKQAPSQAMALL